MGSFLTKAFGMVPDVLVSKRGFIDNERDTKMKNTDRFYWFLIVGTSFALAYAIAFDARADDEEDEDDDNKSEYATDFCREAQNPTKSASDRTLAGILCIAVPCMSKGNCSLEGTVSSSLEGKLASRLKASPVQEWHGSPGYNFNAKLMVTPQGYVQAGYNLGFGWKSRELTFGSKMVEGTSFDYSAGFELSLGFGEAIRPEIFLNGYMGFSDLYTPEEDHSAYVQDPNNQSWNTPQEPSRSDIVGFRGYGVGARLLFGSLIYATGGINRTHYDKVPVVVDGVVTKESQEPVTRYDLGAGLRF